MKKKVTLRELLGEQIVLTILIALYYWMWARREELLGEQIVLTILIALYYWMWARRDWQSYYEVIQNCVAVFAILFFAIMADRIRKYKKEAKDELAIQNLRRSDAICMKIVVVGMIAIAFAGAVEAVSGIVMGYLLVGLLVVLAVVRTVAFSVMDLKGV